MTLIRRTLRTIAGLCVAAAWPALATPTATFDYVSYRALEEVPVEPGTFRNPILPGFHPDPSIVAVGRDFYLVTSTFAWFPGLPIFHSTDLVNWRLIGHAIDRPGQVDFTGLGTNRGLFAPAITHHSGKFWIVNTCIDCRGNFVITADKPEGPWSDPVWLDFGGIDPSLFFDDDGSAWIVYNDAPPGEPLYEGHRALWIQRFDAQAMRVLPRPRLLVNGGLDLAAQPVWAEGPHIYKVGEWYYLTTAEGGTADRHSQTIYRSRKVDGPYEAGPLNPILTQRDLDPKRPDRVEATGHADMVQLSDGSWWGVFLATRPFAGQSTLLGRETFALPVRWSGGWPRFLDPGEAMPSVVARPPLAPSPGTDWSRWRDDFDQQALSPEWIGLRTPGPVQRVMLGDGTLRLVPEADTAGSLGKAAFVGRRLRHHRAEYVTRVTFTPQRDGEFAGLLAQMDENHFVAVGIEGTDVVLRRRTASEEPERGREIGRVARPGQGPVELRLRFEDGTATAYVRAAGRAAWRRVGEADVEPLASIHAGLFTGVVVGPYAAGAP